MDYSKQRQKSVHRKKLYENLNEMPFYIEEFVEYKELHDASPPYWIMYMILEFSLIGYYLNKLLNLSPLKTYPSLIWRI